MRKISSTVASIALLFSTTAFAADFNVASNVGNVPFEFEDASGKVVGFEVDLIDLVAKHLGKTVDYTQMPFNSLFAAVQSGRANIAIGSITITKKRLESVSFSQPYYDADQCVTAATAGGIKNLDGLKGKDVAVITGSTGEIWATANSQKVGFSEVRRYDGNNDPMLDIATGRISAYIHDCPQDKYYIKDKPQYTIIDTISTSEQFGLMFTKNSPLLKDVNDAITELKKTGEIDKLHQKWFGAAADPKSSTVTVQVIPSL
ncbi:transporter substrate-binding domain-containing protein [Agrobacterium tumefaciens]|uniref:Transporter substrate-binding domain-containing protein n=1 Tax=Agrobacterium tumefaciens TaxID=358 RepID=A0AA44J8T5_AGRTU|nr:transporter substrate-binding domain-containing protein [Agrobacterium tumefaciens]NSL21232.1 transporter substrate-binding domain-containing protein [Agrobacterium tumefaciens]NTB83804.1 transporter substrate-binding domain-containing protein [Agrobacterium tumefaciens]NTC20727.1 transporter substrate-binding domain-containing protein [Agrobacterium tumefaciens]NTC29275.1 transporter substrate-binding domain-containing protein [Agrobacterium tumefaciens]NTC57771.1 transporter substrate-bin